MIYGVFYYLFILLGTVLSIYTGLKTAKRKGLHSRAATIFVCFAIIAGFAGAVAMGRLQTMVMTMTGLSTLKNNLRIFGGLIITPYLLLIPVKYLGGDYRRVTDVLSPGLYLLLGCSKLGCAAFGCCYGIEWEYGIHSRFTDVHVFPVQLLESILCFVVAAIAFYMIYNKKHREGTAYPVTMIIYGVTRFLAEYLRYYPETERTYFFGMNFWQMMSVFTVVMGAVWLVGVLIRKKGTASYSSPVI